MSSWTALSSQGGLVDASDGLSGQSQGMRIRSGIQCLFADEGLLCPFGSAWLTNATRFQAL